MQETKAYKTYLGYATGRVKRPSKKSSDAPTTGVVIRETPVKSLSKKKEKKTMEKHKGIDLLSKVALTKEAQYKEVGKKSLSYFYKTHPSGSGTVTKIAPSAAKIKPSITNEGTGVKPGVLDVTEEESSKSEVKSWGNDEDDSNNEQDSSGEDNSYHETDENESGLEFDQEENEEDIGDDEEEVKDEEDETKILLPITDKTEGDEDKEMDYTTKGTDAEMTNVQQGNENSEITQVIEDAHVTFSTVLQKTEVLVTSSSHSSELAFKCLNFLDIPHTDVEIVSPMDVHVHHEVP
ncbi:hypothetical protein Tco_1567823, partial [Tanacetum coccineum]